MPPALTAAAAAGPWTRGGRRRGRRKRRGEEAAGQPAATPAVKKHGPSWRGANEAKTDTNTALRPRTLPLFPKRAELSSGASSLEFARQVAEHWLLCPAALVGQSGATDDRLPRFWRVARLVSSVAARLISAERGRQGEIARHAFLESPFHGSSTATAASVLLGGSVVALRAAAAAAAGGAASPDAFFWADQQASFRLAVFVVLTALDSRGPAAAAACNALALVVPSLEGGAALLVRAACACLEFQRVTRAERDPRALVLDQGLVLACVPRSDAAVRARCAAAGREDEEDEDGDADMGV